MKLAWLWISGVLMIWWHRNLAYSRRYNPLPRACDGCGWVGRQRDAIHGYVSDSWNDVEAQDRCPKCNYEL